MQAKQAWIKNRQERKQIYGSIGLALILLLGGLYFLFFFYPDSYHTRAFKGFFKEFGSYARIFFFVVLAHYALLFVLKKYGSGSWNKIRQTLISLSRYARQWHVPAAIIAMGFALVHATGAFLYGIKFNFENSTGLLTLAALLPITISGILRYKKLDRKFHLITGLTFALLFFLHSFL